MKNIGVLIADVHEYNPFCKWACENGAKTFTENGETAAAPAPLKSRRAVSRMMNTRFISMYYFLAKDL